MNEVKLETLKLLKNSTDNLAMMLSEAVKSMERGDWCNADAELFRAEKQAKKVSANLTNYADMLDFFAENLPKQEEETQ